jgi:hypothetical protein
MSYDSTPHKRVMLQGDPGIDVRTHQDRGDGTALCAIGTLYPSLDSYEVHPPGRVDCLLCGQSNTPEGRASARRRIKRDPRIAESLDDRIARMRREREAKA